MSSEISIEQPATLDAVSRRDDGFRPWHFFVLASILLATVAVILARQSQPEHLILISVTIAAAGVAAGACYRMLAPLTAPVVLRTGEPVSQRTRLALDREKALVLRSIKELEFDRAMGKLSSKDFDEMAGRLRARAISLMRQLDLGSAGYAAEIEKELRKRVQGSRSPGLEGSGVSRSQSAGPDGSVPGSSVPGSPDPGVESGCSCGTCNDHDAVFCKKCGTRLHA